MKYIANRCKINIQSIFIVFILFQNILPLRAQDSSKRDKKNYYRVTMAGGIGGGYPQQIGELGIGGGLEMALQKSDMLYAIGVKGITEFDLFDNSNVSNSINSAEITYGKVFSKGSFFTSLSGGIAWVFSEEKGKLISSSGGWLFTYHTYEKIRRNTIGIPLSAKFIFVPTRFYGFGAEIYANINPVKTFWGINLCHQFGKLRQRKTK